MLHSQKSIQVRGHAHNVPCQILKPGGPQELESLLKVIDLDPMSAQNAGNRWLPRESLEPLPLIFGLAAQLREDGLQGIALCQPGCDVGTVISKVNSRSVTHYSSSSSPSYRLGDSHEGECAHESEEPEAPTLKDEACD